MMNPEANKVIIDLKENIKALVDRYETVKNERNVLVQEKLELVEKVTIITQEKEYLEHQYNLLKMAKSLSRNDGDTKEAKQQISRIVREIDKCIALLNKLG